MKSKVKPMRHDNSKNINCHDNVLMSKFATEEIPWRPAISCFTVTLMELKMIKIKLQHL